MAASTSSGSRWGACSRAPTASCPVHGRSGSSRSSGAASRCCGCGHQRAARGRPRPPRHPPRLPPRLPPRGTLRRHRRTRPRTDDRRSGHTPRSSCSSTRRSANATLLFPCGPRVSDHPGVGHRTVEVRIRVPGTAETTFDVLAHPAEPVAIDIGHVAKESEQKERRRPDRPGDDVSVSRESRSGATNRSAWGRARHADVTTGRRSIRGW